MSSTHKEIVYQVTDTESVIDILYQDMLLCFAKGAKPNIRERINEIWMDKYGFELTDLDVELGYNPAFLHGSPGHGKTTSMKVAGNMVAADLGMIFVLNPPEGYIPHSNDVLFISYELSGQVSSTDFGGLPSKRTIDGHEYMSKVLNYRLAIMKNAGAGILLLDDFSNASPNIQNVGLSIVEERRFQGLDLGNTYIGVTGNLGAQDRTHISSLSAAMESRCKNIGVQDTLENFARRAAREYPDRIGDAGLIGFLRNNEDMFAKPPPAAGPFPSPRTWNKLAKDLRNIMRNRNTPDKVPAIQSAASHMVGKEAGIKMASYFRALFTGVQPIAEAALSSGGLSNDLKKEIQNKRVAGFSAEARDFDNQMAFVVADTFMRMGSEIRHQERAGHIKPDNAIVQIRNLIQGYGAITGEIQSSSVMMSIAHLRSRLNGQNVLSIDPKSNPAENDSESLLFFLEELMTTPVRKSDLKDIVSNLSGYQKWKNDMDIGAGTEPEEDNSGPSFT